MKKYFLFVVYSLFGVLETSGQVKFHLVHSIQNQMVEVQVIPEQSYRAPLDRIGTAQVTLQVPSGTDFTYTSLESSVSGVKWELNSIVRNPAQLPGVDLYSFGMMTFGTDQYLLVANQPTTLFRLIGFSNGQVNLLSSESPILSRVSELKINVGNQFNVLGYRQGLENAYVGNQFEKHLEPKSEKESVFITHVFPNPAKEKTQLGWENYYKGTLKSLQLKVVESGSGRVQWLQDLPIGNGRQSIQLEVTKWPRGMYILSIFCDGEPILEGARLFVTE